MRIAAINGAQGASTGQIMNDLALYAWQNGHEMFTFVPATEYTVRLFPWSETIGTAASHQEHIERGIRTGYNGIYEVEGTREMLRLFEERGIELIHLANLHNFVLNLPLLFQWVKAHHVPVVWTLHSCWPYTGKCVHYSMADCNRWQTGCHNCPLQHRWPYSNTDNSAAMWRLKKKWFSDVEKMVIVGTARWITEDAKLSFLGQYPVRMIHNGIDQRYFHPVLSDFRKQNGLEGKIVLLGVADNWLRHKGLATMIELAGRLDTRYKLVLAGTDEQVEALLPPEILAIRNTRNKNVLAQIYSTADIFLQTTQEETFGMVNVEALACGTPVITFDVGGSPDALDESCGRVVPPGDIDAMLAAVEEQVRTHAMTPEACRKRAEYFSVERMCRDYFALYQEMLNT